MSAAMEQPASSAEFLATLFKSHTGAIGTVVAVLNVLALWSALERGASITPRALRVALWSLLVELPDNEFYRAHYAALNPIIAALALDLMAAGDLEREPDNERALTAAYAARQSWALLLHRCSLIVNGTELTTALAPKIRQFVTSQAFAEYAAEVQQLAASRAGVSTGGAHHE